MAVFSQRDWFSVVIICRLAIFGRLKSWIFGYWDP